VAAPDRLHRADRAAVDERLHLPDHGHVAHVVPHVQARAVLAGRAQHGVAVGGGRRERLLAEGGDAGGQRGQRHWRVQVVGGEDHHRVQPEAEQRVEVGHHRHRPSVSSASRAAS
jgi:hypothetical protein